MTSEIRANKQTNRAGLGTVTYADTGIIVSGIVTCTELSGLTALNIAGVGTANTLDINGDIDVDGHTNLDNVSVAGISTFSEGLFIPDSKELKIGNTNGSPDLKLYHDTTNSYIYNSTGVLRIRSNDLRLQSLTGEEYFYGVTNGGAHIYWDNSLRIQTTSSGVSFPRDIDVDGHTNLDNVNIAGVSTFTGAINANGGASVTGNITATGNLTAAGTLYLTDTIEHTDDSNTKIRFPAADTFSVETDGSERIRIASDGDVIIGNSSPVAGKLEVNTGTEVNGATEYYGQDFAINIRANRGASPNDEGNGICFSQKWYSSASDLVRTGAIVGYKISGDGSFGGGLKIKVQQGGANALMDIMRLRQSLIEIPADNVPLQFGIDGDFRIRHTGSENQIYGTGTHPIVFSNSGGERLRIDSNGQLLVGTSTSGANVRAVFQGYNGGGENFQARVQFQTNQTTNLTNGLHMANLLFTNSSGSVGAQIDVKADGSWGTNDYPGRIEFKTTADGANTPTERLRIDSAGRVQINQTTNVTGTAKLEVMGTGDNTYPQYSFAIGVADTQAYNVSNGSGMGIGFSYKHNNAGSYALGCGIRGFKENTTDGDYAGAMAFYTRPNGAGAGEKARISSAGTFGVGTVNPDSNYRIDCNGKMRIGDGNAGHRIQFSRSGLGDELVLGVDGYGSSTANEAVIQSSINSGRPLVLRTSNGDRLRISAGGRVGIQETETKINGFAENLQVRATYGGGQYGIAVKLNQSSGALMRFATKNPTDGNDNLCGNISGNGTSCSYNTSSDYRLKENDVKISDGISRLKQLRPIRFNWKSDSSFTQDGFFAHEVSPVVPESVTGEKDATVDFKGEGYQNIDHSKLVPLLTAALQEAIARIEALEGS